MPRLFAAINVPPEIRTSLAKLQRDLDGIRWTPSRQFHLTLRFLGDVCEETAAEVTQVLTAIKMQEAVPVDIQGVTAFPSRRSPRIVAAAVARHPALMKLQAQIESSVQELGFSPERRDFRPHVTLGRVKTADASEVHEYLTQQSIADMGFLAREFVLTESTLSPDGAQHNTRETVRLV